MSARREGSRKMVTNYFRLALCGTVAATVLAHASTVNAQTADPEAGRVTDRRAQEFEAQGVRAGSFVFYPKTEVSETYNSNFYQDRSDEEDVWITEISPSVALASDWNRHQVNLDAGATFGLLAGGRRGDDDFIDYTIGGRGQLDVSRALTVNANARFSNEHEARGGDDSPTGASEPTEFDQIQAAISGRYKPNRVSVGGDFQLRYFNYDDSPLLGGGSTNNDDRDRLALRGTGRLGYEIQSGYEGYVSGSINQVDYDSKRDDNGLERSSNGYGIAAGVAIELTRLLRGDFNIGWRVQDFDDGALEDVQQWSANAQFSWFVTNVTTLRFGFGRGVNETTINNVSATLPTSIDIGVDHELLRNLTLSADAGYTETRHPGNGRIDDTLRAGAKVDYKLNRYVFAGVNYQLTNRDSNSGHETNNYFAQEVGIRIGAQF